VKRYRSLVAYDGTNYFGYQRQRAAHVTVQVKLEEALAHISQQPVGVVAAGRTDTGVHATGQVIAFDLDWRHGVAKLERAFNSKLPADISVSQVAEAEETFHPRFDARRRAYQYRIYNQKDRDPIGRLYSWHVKRPLDIEAMNEAARHLVGVHDFAAFGKPTQGDSTVREMFRAEWRKQGSMLLFDIEASGFLYRMVRRIVGSLKRVGEGLWTPDRFAEVFLAAESSQSGPTAPPHGLFLVSVTY